MLTKKFDVYVVQDGIVVAQNNGKERQKSVLQVQICFFLCQSDLSILMPFSLPSPFRITRYNFVLFIGIINQSFAFSPRRLYSV